MAASGIEDQVSRLISLAEEAAQRSDWLASLDYASQALTGDATRADAAVLVGAARARLDAVGRAGPELRQLTVVAVDMHGSTSIAAATGPERMRELMLELYEVCVEAVARFEGRVSKYLGDGVLAQFGYPVVHDDDARRAVLASLAIIAEVEGRSEEWESRFGERIAIRIGVDSGIAAVGPMDASPWSGEELAGDPPNIASRVQATADRMTVRVTDATNQLIRGWIETLPVGPVELRNYPRPIGLHRVLGATSAETRLEARGGTRPPLLGRDRELGALREAWSRVGTERERQVVNLIGEPGIGKSRLIEHMIATAVATGAVHVTFACSRLHRDSALRPVSSALGRFFRFSALERENDALLLDAIRRQLEQLGNREMATEEAVPAFGWLLGNRSAVDLEPELIRRKSFEAVIDLLEALAATSGLVVCVDDADFADPSTLELLRRLFDRPEVPMLVVLTSREEVTGLGEGGTTMELDGLPDDDATALVGAVSPNLGEDIVDQIVAASEGVPYLLEEQARSAEERVGDVAGDALELDVFLSARLDELGSDHRHLLGEIAVAGGSLRIDVLRQLTENTPADLELRLDELVRRRVLLRSSEPRGEVIRFRHGLMREAAYDGLLEARRAELHRRIATYMEGLGPGAVEPEDIASHFARAGAGAEAARWWGEAGNAAIAAGANLEAVGLFERSLDALEQDPDGADTGVELQLQLGLGTARSIMDGYTSSQARESFERAVVLGDGLEDTSTLFPALWGTWSYWFVLGELRLASGLADRCLRIGREADDERLRFEAGAIVGYQRLHEGDFEGARSELEIAARHVGQEPFAAFPHDPGIVSQSALAIALWFLGEVEASRDAAEEAVSLVESLAGDDRRRGLTDAWVRSNHAWRSELEGEHEEAVEMAERAAAIAGERGYATWLGAATLHRSIGICGMGDFEQGLPMLAATVDAWRSAGRDESGRQLHPVLMTPYFAGRLAEIKLAVGDRAGAAAEIEEVLATTARSGERFWDERLMKLREEQPAR